MHLTTFSPPAIIGDLALIFLCYMATEHWDHESHKLAIQALLWWMFVSKFIKLMGHYIRYPVDFVFLPISIFFGYFHGLIKVYAATTLNVVSSFFLRFTLTLAWSLVKGRAHSLHHWFFFFSFIPLSNTTPPALFSLMESLSSSLLQSMSFAIKPFSLSLPFFPHTHEVRTRPMLRARSSSLPPLFLN